MSKIAAMTGWIIAAITVGTAVFFLQQSVRYQSRAAQLQMKLDDLTRESARNNERSAIEIEGLKKRITELSSVSGRQLSKQQVHASQPAPTAVPMVAPMAPSTSASPESRSKEAGNLIVNGIASGVSAEMVKGSANLAYKLQYELFLKKLKLTPELEKKVKEIIIRNMSEMMGDGINMFSTAPAEQSGKLAAAQQKLRDELSEVLTPEQMTEWDKYQKTMPEQMLSRLMQMELAQAVPELTPENRFRASQVMLEELVALREETGGQGQVVDLLNAGLERSRNRLAQEFSPDQMALLDQFLNQQGQVIQQGLRMIGGMKGE